MNCSAAPAVNKNFFGIGKIMLNAQDTSDYNIPHMHFILSHAESMPVEAINLEFGLVASGATPEEAIEHLSEMIIEFVTRTIESLGYNAIIDDTANCTMNLYWTEYRRMEFMLAKTKNDIGHSVVDAIKDSVRKELLKKYGIDTDAKFSIVNGAVA